MAKVLSLSMALILPGDLLISEVMSNPAAVSDSNGEWFEVYNTRSEAIDLNGLIIRDLGSNHHAISNSETLLLPAYSYYVFARNDDSASNGGLLSDYVLSGFSLGNSSDAIILEYDQQLIFSLQYSNNPIFNTAGNSAEWQPSGYQLTDSAFRYGDGDIGSPGSGDLAAAPSEVPLPAAVWFMGSALIGLASIKGKHRH